MGSTPLASQVAGGRKASDVVARVLVTAEEKILSAEGDHPEGRFAPVVVWGNSGVIKKAHHLVPAVEGVPHRAGHGTLGGVLIFALDQPGMKSVHDRPEPSCAKLDVLVGAGDGRGFEIE